MRHGDQRFFKLIDRQPVACQNVGEWAHWCLEQGENYPPRVGFDTANDDSFTVLTVFLGINYRWNSRGDPLVFETMVSYRGGDDNADDMIRSTTWDEAVRTHNHAITIANLRRRTSKGRETNDR